jgi:hypothetical protein
MSEGADRPLEFMPDGEGTASEVTRRGVIAGAGGAVAGGLLVVGVPSAVGAPRRKRVGSGRTDRHSVGFLGQINQEGPILTVFGYLTRVQGISTSALYTVPPAVNSNDPRAADPNPARFTFLGRAKIDSMSRRTEVLASTATGRVQIFAQPGGGANFNNPNSFADGQVIASYRGTFLNDLLVDGANQGSFVMTGDLTQSRAPCFRFGGRRLRFGAKGLPWNLNAAGRGIRTEPTIPRATISVSGDLGVIDAEVPEAG